MDRALPNLAAETTIRRRPCGQAASGRRTAATAKDPPGLRLRPMADARRRCLAVKLRDTTNTAILLAQAPVIALLVVMVFGKRATGGATEENWQSAAQATSVTVFLLALAALWFGCSNSVREIVGEWAIYHRERMVNLKVPSYVGSKFMVLGGLCFLQCAVLLGIVYRGAGLKGPWSAMFLLLLLTALVGLGIGLTISALARPLRLRLPCCP